MKKRLRKKHHLGEFRELCFEVAWRSADNVSPGESDDLLDRFIEMIEANGLQFGGGGNGDDWSGVVELCGRGSATDRHREIVRRWLATQPEISSVSIGELVDAWHGWN